MSFPSALHIYHCVLCSHANYDLSGKSHPWVFMPEPLASAELIRCPECSIITADTVEYPLRICVECNKASLWREGFWSRWVEERHHKEWLGGGMTAMHVMCEICLEAQEAANFPILTLEDAARMVH